MTSFSDLFLTYFGIIIIKYEMAHFGIYDQKQTRKSMPPDLKCNSRYFQNRFAISHNCETALFGEDE